jgi:Bacterial archaeo-eukaryotic release factor family 3
MLTSRQMTLKPLLDSKDGIHLTAYLVNRRDLIDLKSQVRTTIADANDWLADVISTDERKKFLEPLEALLNDARIFKQMKGNIGIFRNKESFRILNIPIDIVQTCQVATSFHVKPLLRWLQGDQEFLFLGLEKQAAYLYLGSQDSFKLIDSVLFPDFFCTKENASDYISLKSTRQKKAKEAETFKWLNEWILDLTKNSKPKLFIAGEPSLVQALNKNLNYISAIKTPVSQNFSQRSANENCQRIRKILKADSKQSLEKALLEFRFAEEGNRAKKNIFQISKAVVQGKVRKLIVTDDLSIFGKIDQKSGGIAIHPVDLDHEDDCILDDLAQMVLSQGGEVIVAKRNEIPKGRPVLAILEDDSPFLEKTEELQYEVLEERFG